MVVQKKQRRKIKGSISQSKKFKKGSADKRMICYNDASSSPAVGRAQEIIKNLPQDSHNFWKLFSRSHVTHGFWLVLKCTRKIISGRKFDKMHFRGKLVILPEFEFRGWRNDVVSSLNWQRGAWSRASDFSLDSSPHCMILTQLWSPPAHLQDAQGIESIDQTAEICEVVAGRRFG